MSGSWFAGPGLSSPGSPIPSPAARFERTRGASSPSPRTPDESLPFRDRRSIGSNRTSCFSRTPRRRNCASAAGSRRRGLPFTTHSRGSASHEKKTLRADEQPRPDIASRRQTWRESLSGVDPRRLIDLDETGAKTNMTRAFARSRKGERAPDYAPQGHGNTTTRVAAITWRSAIAPMVLDGPMDAAAFEVYVEQAPIPARPAGAILVMDNPSAHKSPAIARLPNGAGVEPRYRPPHSPDFNPIEPMGAKVKGFPKRTCGTPSPPRFRKSLRATREAFFATVA
jgi:hypothetical protein